MNRVWRMAVVTVVALLALSAAFAVSGQFGLVIAADCLAVLALITALASTPGGVRERGALRPGAIRAWMGRHRIWPWRTAPPVLRAADFPAYAKISSDVSWAPVSQWHFDHGLRRLLSHLLESVLAERHRVVWPLIDPSRPPSSDSKAPGADLRTLARIVDRLEQL